MWLDGSLSPAMAARCAPCQVLLLNIAYSLTEAATLIAAHGAKAQLSPQLLRAVLCCAVLQVFSMGDIRPSGVADPEARAALVWILGHFGQHIESERRLIADSCQLLCALKHFEQLLRTLCASADTCTLEPGAQHQNSVDTHVIINARAAQHTRRLAGRHSLLSPLRTPAQQSGCNCTVLACCLVATLLPPLPRTRTVSPAAPD
jgi:hypothetical protein